MSNNALEFGDVQELGNFLTGKGVDISQYGSGEAKDLDDLYSELQSGEVSLNFDEASGKIIRTVRVLNVDVLHGDNVLYESKQVFKDDSGNETERQRVRDHLTVAVSEKIGPDENPIEGVQRAVQEELDIALGEDQLQGEILLKEEGLESPSFPQIWTVYQILTTSVELTENQFEADGYREEQAKKNTYFEWVNQRLYNRWESILFGKIDKCISVHMDEDMKKIYRKITNGQIVEDRKVNIDKIQDFFLSYQELGEECIKIFFENTTNPEVLETPEFKRLRQATYENLIREYFTFFKQLRIGS